MNEQQFLRLCEQLGYQPLPFHNGDYLVTNVKPKLARVFDGCTRQTYHPEAVSNPRRERVEIIWRRSTHEWSEF